LVELILGFAEIVYLGEYTALNKIVGIKNHNLIFLIVLALISPQARAKSIPTSSTKYT
jgi:hypothetical protein